MPKNSMKEFMDTNFLLSNETAKVLFYDYAAKVPIIDYHCHINPEDIEEDRKFDNITQLWLSGDHYKWRFMRSCGVSERLITGDASDHDKFVAWATVLGCAIGNPLYHWSHLELKRYFNFNKPLSEETAEEAWEHCNRMLQDPSMSVRNIIKKSHVEVICTTDDPADDLKHHAKIAMDPSFDVTVLPAWRPDRAVDLEKPDYLEYLDQLSRASGVHIKSYSSLISALKIRMEFFARRGCKICDHGMSYVPYEPASSSVVEGIFVKRSRMVPLTKLEEAQFKTALLLELARNYHRLGWVMQLHFGVKRDNNTRMFNAIGANTGFDCADNCTNAAQLADFLNALDETNELPKTILYSLNPADNLIIGSIIGCFQEGPTFGKIQQGSAWWFNDHKNGMREQMLSLASQGNLAGFLGMLTDSRSFLSYTRHEYFRRVLCDVIGTIVENGEFPADMELLGGIVEDISYYNAKEYFGF